MKNKTVKTQTGSGAAWMPEHWTFDSREVAKRFDAHVREQLPWYDQLTAAVVHIGAHYIPEGGLVYDIGASTGNTGRLLAPYLTERHASLVSIEQSPKMCEMWSGPGELVLADALQYDFKPFDFGICLLTLMFLPVAKRAEFVAHLQNLVRPGGALVIVDKVLSPPGYAGTVLRRMAMKWKLDAGATPDEIVAKELSLGGVQRPINPHIIPVDAHKFFHFGEFAGWVWERSEGGRG